MADKTPVGTRNIDYEREYYRLIETVNNLSQENTRLRNTIIEMCKYLFDERRFNNG